MKVAGESPLCHVGSKNVRVSDALLYFTPQRCKFDQSANCFGITSKPCEFVAHMARAIDAVRLSNRDPGTDEGVQQWKFVTHRGVSVIFNEGKSCGACQIGPVVEKYAFPGHENVVKYRERLDHFVCCRDGPCKGLSPVKKIRSVHSKPRGGRWHGKGNRPWLVTRHHVPAW